jgi:GNAT superfamily N-acetyltransferase
VTVIDEPATDVRIRELGAPGDLGWVVRAHGELYVEEFGWDTTFEAMVARIVADYADEADPARRRAWIAELDGERVGCVFVVPDDEPRVARLRILLVNPRARGRSIGSQLVQIALDFAAAAGYDRMRLWTNHPLVAARAIYLRHGFTLVNESPHRSFGVDLIGQTYERDLIDRAASGVSRSTPSGR